MTQLYRKLVRRGRKFNYRPAPMDPKLKPHTERMTNWQRMQWARSGYRPFTAPAYANLLYGARFAEATPTGRLTDGQPNMQNIPIRTPEGAAIREALTR